VSPKPDWKRDTILTILRHHSGAEKEAGLIYTGPELGSSNMLKYIPLNGRLPMEHERGQSVGQP